MNKYSYKNLTPFKWFVLENFPFIEADFDALTEWQIFCKLGKEINKIIDSQNLVGEQAETLTNAFNDLQNYVNNYFNNLDLQDEINNKLNEMAEDGTLDNLLSKYINNNILRIYENVDSLKKDNLPENAKVKTLGFYNANDGGGAYYIIKNTNILNKINIITLNNGLQAHLIIENNTINYKMFGAKLNGTDDSLIIKQVHNFANENNFDIVQNGGDLKCNFTATVKTNLKLNCNLLIDDDTPDIVYDVVHDLEEIDTPLNLTANLQIIDNVLLLNKFCCPISDDDTSKIGNRNNATDTTVYYHKQPLAVNNAGEILTSSQFIAHSANFHLLGYSDLNEKGVIIEGGKIIVNLSKIGFPSLFRLWRNNSTIKNFDVVLQKFGNKENGRYPYALFLSWAGCHQIFDNITAINNTLNDKDDYSYIFSCRYSWNILIENCSFSQGWGNTALFWTDGITFKKCTSNRFDNHYGSFGNLSILDCILTGIGKIRIGYGNGQLLIDNLKINKKNFDAIVETRTDFNIIFQGTIKVQNITDIEDYTVSLVDIADSQNVNNFPNDRPTTIISNVNLLNQRRFIRSLNHNRIQCFVNNCQNVPLRSEGDIELYANNCRIVNMIENSSRVWLTACEVATDNMNVNRLYAKASEFRNNISVNGLSLILACHLTAQCSSITNNSSETVTIANSYSDSVITKNGTIYVNNCNQRIPE